MTTYEAESPGVTREVLARILDAVPGGVVHVGLDGAIKNANPEALRVLGFRYDDLTARYVSDFDTETLHEDGRPCPASEYPVSVVLATGEPAAPLTIGVRRPDGETHWATFRAVPVRGEDGALAGAIVTFLDVTERRRAFEKLHESEQKWRSLAEHLPDFVIVADQEMRIVYINRLLGQYVEDDVIGTSCLAFLAPAHVPQWRDHFEAALTTRKSQRFETIGIGADGRGTLYETIIVPMPQGDAVDRVLVVARDISERRAMFASVAEKERLASLGMVSASVAHEMMNPLTYVLANLEFALGPRCTDDERRKKALGEAREGALRMQEIAQDLRALGRSSDEDLFYVDARAVLDIALRLAGTELSRRARVIVEVAELPPVLASQSRLCQVFINLLVNAAQAVEEAPGGAREIRVRSRQDAEAGLVGVEIADTGPGIPEDALPRIFEPFYTTKANGTGLGLSICRDILDRMGGRIDVATALDEGSRFTVWLSTTRSPVTDASSAR